MEPKHDIVDGLVRVNSFWGVSVPTFTPGCCSSGCVAGTGTSFIGWSAHCLTGGVTSYEYGERFTTAVPQNAAVAASTESQTLDMSSADTY